MPTLLLCLLALPLATAVVVALIGSAHRPVGSREAAHRTIRWLSLACTLVCLVLAIVLVAGFIAAPEHQAHEQGPGTESFRPLFVPGAGGNSHATTWNLITLGAPDDNSAPAIQFYVGLDGLNVWLVLLTALLLVPSVLISWTAIEERVPEFYAWLLVLETGMIGVFVSFDIILFYVFFELTLVPLFFNIGIWGGPQRQYAARKFFIYTLGGSLLTLLGLLGIVLTLANDAPDKKLTFAIPELVRQVDRHGRALEDRLSLVRQRLADAEAAGEKERVDAVRGEMDEAEGQWRHWRRVQVWLFLAMMCGFAIKVPLVPLHTWLPLAHVEAPTAGSVLLAGVLLKIGTYGFLRLCLPLTPDASLRLGAPLIGSLAVIGILYGAFCALGQHDIKRLVAYSSVSHLGFCMLGMFALNEPGLSGSLIQMINHGLSTGALFLLVGMLYERYHTRKLHDYGGMGKRLHLLAFFFVFITMSSIGLPGLNGFVGEALVLMGMYRFVGTEVNGRLLAALSTFGVLLGAWYMLTAVLRIFCGPVREPPTHAEGHGPHGDLNGREVFALAPIALCCLALGLYPKLFLDTIRPDVRVVEGIAARARIRAERPGVAPPPPAEQAAGVRE
jgi:NADH-quinone oxidoreductase subunit M